MAERKYSNESEEKEETLATPGVIDKYQEAGKIANSVLQKVLLKCTPEASILDLCVYGDQEMEKQIGQIYNKKKIEKGIAHPTCISVDNVCGYFSPLASEN
jgi:methionine aminopeptidase